MRQVLRYYLNGPMRTEFLTQGLRAGSYADRFRAALMYVGWKEERGVEPITLTTAMLVEWLKVQDAAAMQTGQEAPDMTIFDEFDFETMAMDPGREEDMIELTLRNLPGAAERKRIGRQSVQRALAKLRAGEESAVVHASYVKRSSPCWEALQPFVDSLSF